MKASDERLLAVDENIEKILLKPKRVFELLDISRSTGYAMIASGELPSIRIGRAVRVPMDALKQWVAERTTGAERNEDGERGEVS